MAPAIDYFFAAQSPWTYLGHERFVRMARAAGAQVRVRPADYGKVFPASGGLPLPKRAPQRQAYRLVELKRFSDHLGVPLNVQPRHFPVNPDDASRLIVAVERDDGADAALALSGAVFAAVWRQERDIASAQVLGELLSECGLPAARLEGSREPAVQQAYEANTQAAIDAGVFGAPSYVVDGEIFWGQDRLDFLERKLRSFN
ncbi:2-hydroxychromene-2-carboxylate isomerase [Ramlibacter sp. Leaf400]|uniref:2-hydroxychromene-2-carboxylate isomerase n=1 Tax=Ramlibacter sp. Leaf400 TaxID=1736365 RepID=UPI0006F5E572|nr:2-hydroxychromene-2-carboxylate isomerase [Ramlibacter sp. Leaf400]KQT12492.1 2-hydroxychromene-2-carboxylate isomerase [Ramlibacter sp. Leaf400]